MLFLISCENKIEKEVPEPDEDAFSDSDQIEDSDVVDDSDDGDGSVFGLKVEANEKNVLSCRLSFSTSEEMKTFVKYYSPTHSGYKIVEDSAETEHYFFLWGMRENLDYTIEIYDEKNGGLLATTEFHSGILPDFVHKPTLVINEKKHVQPGFLLFSQTTENDEPQIPLILMVDTDGFVVWYYFHDIAGVAYLDDPEYMKKTQTVFMGVHKYPSMDDIPAEEGIEIDLEGNVVWKSPDLPGSFYEETSWHHEYKLLDDGSIMFLKALYSDSVIVDRVVNVDRNYTELWSWGYLDSPDYFTTVECPDPSSAWCDWTHTNSAMMFKNDGILYFNSLYLGFFKMDMNEKKILWKFGKDGDFTIVSEHDFPWTDGTHDPKFADAARKRLLFFDNGIRERKYSRVIEYEIDEEAMTAEITFEYDGIYSGHGWFSSGWGDADYLENGNIFVARGYHDNAQAPSVFEITREKEVVWELYLWRDGDKVTKIYNSAKFVPPLEFLKEDRVLNLKVEENEKNVLSGRLSFSTAEAKKTFVKYYSATHSGYKIGEDSAGTDHYFFLWGMRENTDYKIEIYDEETGELLATTGFHSGVVPESIYPFSLGVNEKKSVQPGFLLMTQNTTNNWKQYPVIFMVDTDGFVVWYYEYDGLDGTLLCDAKYHEKTRTVFVGIQKDISMSEIPFEEGIEIDLEGNILWKSPSVASHSYTENGWHHQYTLLDDDTILFIQAQYRNMMLSDRVLNVDRNYNELWNWGYLDSLDDFELPECADSTTDWCDWTHTNAVMMYKESGEIYLNSLRLGFYKMDMNTKKVLWKFAKDGDFKMLSKHDFPWTDSTHSPEFYDSSKKRLLFFDNGMTERPYSRIIEYEIDEDAKTAEITFEYDGRNDDRGWYAQIGWGDADYLENGNILVAKGWVDPPENSSVFEVTRDGRVVWELLNHQDENFMVEIYKVEKFMPQLEFLNE